MMPESVISNYFRGKTILVTGATGSIGKVLIWKLLLSCAGIDTIYVLMRPKRGKNVSDRVSELLQIPIFDNFKRDNPQILNKVQAIPGDLSEDGLGLSEVDERKLIRSVHIIFHAAAVVKFNAPLKDAVEANVGGAQKVLELATRMPNLQAFVHTSTAYCLYDVTVLGENVYGSKHSPEEILKLVRSAKPETLRCIEKDLIKPFPNTYAFSKRVTENLVAGYHHKLPVAITRPTIVTPSLSEPIPGWVDDKNNLFLGMLIAAGSGVLHVALGDKQNHLDLIPCDIVCNSLILVAWKLGRNTQNVRLKEVPVYNLGALETEMLTQDGMVKLGSETTNEYPFSMLLWYPFVIVTSNFYIYTTLSILLQWIPAYVIDALLRALGYKAFMVRIQRKIHEGIAATDSFSLNEWNFVKDSILRVREELSEEDKNVFKVTCKGLNIKEYCRNAALLTRRYLMKDDPATLPTARLRLKMLYVLHCFVKACFWLYVGYLFFHYVMEPLYCYRQSFL